MMVNTLMRLVSTMLQRLLGDNTDDTAQMQKVTLPQFIVRTDDFKVICLAIRYKNYKLTVFSLTTCHHQCFVHCIAKCDHQKVS